MDVLRGKAEVGRRVAVIGAGGIGFDVSEYLLGEEVLDTPAEERLQDIPSFLKVCFIPMQTAYLSSWLLPPSTIRTKTSSAVMLMVMLMLMISLPRSLPIFPSPWQEWKIDNQLSTRGGVAKAKKNKKGDGDHHHDAPAPSGGGREIWL